MNYEKFNAILEKSKVADISINCYPYFLNLISSLIELGERDGESSISHEKLVKWFQRSLEYAEEQKEMQQALASSLLKNRQPYR